VNKTSGWLLVIALTVGCGSDAGSAPAGSCDPLALDPQPITLGDVLAVGVAAGITYVVSRSEDGADYRVFVSDGETLVRRRVLGSGFGGSGDSVINDTVSYQDAMTSRLVLKSEAGAVTAMALVHDAERTFYDDAAGKIELMLQPASTVESKPLRNLPGEVDLLYAANASDGAQIMVTQPADDSAEVRLYYGRANRLRERVVTNVSRSSVTAVRFELDSTPAEAVFSSPQLAPNTPSTLTRNDGPFALTLLPTGTGLPSGWSFDCLP
jgi:hypothetical protein